MTQLRVATRGSELALAQARRVSARLESVLCVTTELVIVTTSGDRLQHAKLADVGGKGLFVKEIEEALLERRADVAVHSAKDLPAALAPGLVLAAVPERADPRDAFVPRERGARLAELPRGARVGTGSARRSAQLHALRPDLVIVPLRGNVPTRLRKLETEGLDAIVLACAGLDRLGLSAAIGERLTAETLLPALGQGTLALEARAGEALARELAALDEPGAATMLAAERAFLARMQGDCNVPLAGLAEVTAGGRVRLRGLVSLPDGSAIARGEADAPSSGAAGAGARAAEHVLAAGGAAILEALRATAAAARAGPRT